ncbi:MAG: shikimate dehydrogenase [Acidobacteria bacterium]|nr:MAG: shikimate dehydrogenase [Acidobacteriota bacterium]
MPIFVPSHTMKAASVIPAPRFLRMQFPRVCTVVIAQNPADLLEKVDQVCRDNSFIEIRLDYLSKPALAFPRLKQFFAAHRDITAIATCRRAVNGGHFRGSVASQYELLIKAAQNGFRLLDVELETAAQLKPHEFEKLRNVAAVVLSFHDFKGTKKLGETWQRMQEFPADIFKAVSTARTLSDNLAMLRLLQAHSDHYTMVGLCMGELGIISRVLGVRAGSAFTFAAAREGEETAPGQITSKALRETYRIDRVDAATKVYAVAGDPISHSLSPVMMNTAFRRENINAVYIALQPREINDLLSCMQEIPIHGLSVTMPLKQEIIKHLDRTDALTQKIGACNTVIRSADGKFYGFNTDVAGVIRPLEERINLRGARILVLGAGGAARAAVFGLKERGSDVYDFDVIINATPVGMKSSKPQAPLEENELRTKYLFEMIYSPLETKLVKMARAKNIHVITGDAMFVHQGVRQFEIWTGKPAPFEDMHRSVLFAIAQRDAQGNGK